jgi:hypothetical protein
MGFNITASLLRLSARRYFMNQGLKAAFVCGLLAGFAAAPVSAHHSFAAAYNMDQPITIEGVIVQVRLTNPHSWFFLDVTNEDGEVERWSFEAGTPSGMIRNGYKPSVIKKGATVTISGFHARDASQNSGMLRQLVMEDGTVYGMFGPQEGSSAR